MKVEQLIAELQKLPAGTEVLIFDAYKNMLSDDGNGTSAGLYDNFVVEFDEGIVSETDPKARFATLLFANEDYDKDGNYVHPLYLEALREIDDLRPTIGGERS